MKISKAIFAVVAGAALSGVAMAEDNAAVSAEKTSGIKTLIPGAYGNFELRHQTNRKMEDEKVVNVTPVLSARPTLGTTLFGDKVDTAFTWIFVKKADEVKVTKALVYNETTYSALSAKYGSITPYAYSEVDANGSGFSTSDVGINFGGKLDMPLASGALLLEGYTEPKARFMSAKAASEGKVSVENRTGEDTFALNEAGDTTLEQRDPTLLNDTGISLKYSPAAVKGLSVKAAVDYTQEWAPQYAAKSVDNDTRTELDHYKNSSAVLNRLNVGYKLTDTVSLTNSVRYWVGGAYASGIDGSKAGDNLGLANRWENRLSLTATLF